jgi:hypothetical protein
MTTVTAYYDGLAFVPVEPVDLEKGTVIQLSVIRDSHFAAEHSQRVTAFNQLTAELRELNKTEPLPPAFDEILDQGISFTREFEL